MTKRDGDAVTVRRYLPNSLAPPTYVRAVGFRGNIDRWMQIQFVPGLVQVYAGSNDAGKGVDDTGMNDTLGARIFNGVTPETEHTTHYFWSAAHNFRVDQPQTTESFFLEVQAAFMEAQYRNIRKMTKYRTVEIRSDAGGLQARWVIAAQEQAEAAAGAGP